jgi:hypothetical protein
MNTNTNKFINHLRRNGRVNVSKPNNYNNRKGYTHLKLKTKNGGAQIVIGLNEISKQINYLNGSTRKANRGKGKGIFIRAIPVLSAKNTGFKKITHFGIIINYNQKKKYNLPPSSRIVKFLGFKKNNTFKSNFNNNSVYSELDLSSVNFNRIKRITNGNYTMNNYRRTFTV